MISSLRRVGTRKQICWWKVREKHWWIYQNTWSEKISYPIIFWRKLEKPLLMMRLLTKIKRMMNLSWSNLRDTICQLRFRSQAGLAIGGARSWSPAPGLRRKVRGEGDDQMTARHLAPDIQRHDQCLDRCTLQHMIPSMRIFRDNFKVKILPHGGKILLTFPKWRINLKSITV